MDLQQLRDRRIFEGMLILLILGMTTLFYKMGVHGLVALNLFFLPVVISGYFMGRTSSGVLALLCALCVTSATMLLRIKFTGYSSPVMVGLALTIWAATLGLTAILMGTLCDERARTVRELQKAYVGVVEVLSKYLQSAHPGIKARSTRIAELSQLVAQEMKLPRKQVDDVRVAALLHDLENVEITTQVLNTAVNSLEKARPDVRHTFLGTDLVHSLGSVLEGALPLLVAQNEAVRDAMSGSQEPADDDLPVGAKIIAAVRGFDSLIYSDAGPRRDPREALRDLRTELPAGYHDVLVALERVVERTAQPAARLAPAYV